LTFVDARVQSFSRVEITGTRETDAVAIHPGGILEVDFG
jgi:hypothetical protein